MKISIEKSYLEKSFQIRKEYFQKLSNVLDKEEDVHLLEQDLFQIIQQTERDSKRMTQTEIHHLIQERSMELEKKMQKMKEELLPIYTRILELRKESIRLYNSIAEKYTNLTVNEVKKQIVNYIQSIGDVDLSELEQKIKDSNLKEINI